MKIKKIFQQLLTYGHQKTQQTQSEELNLDLHRFDNQQPSEEEEEECNVTPPTNHNKTAAETAYRQI